MSSTAGAVTGLNHTQQYVEEAAEREVHDDTGSIRHSLGEKIWYLVKADGEIRTAGSDKLNQPQQYTTAILRKWVGRPLTACGRQRWNDGIRACCLLSIWYMSGRCAHSSSWEPREENRQQYYTGTYVQTKASRTETREIVLSTPAGTKNLERPPRAPGCMDGAETSTNVSSRASCVRVLTVLPKSARTKRKVGESAKNWQTYVYIQRTRCTRVSGYCIFDEKHGYPWCGRIWYLILIHTRYIYKVPLRDMGNSKSRGRRKAKRESQVTHV